MPTCRSCRRPIVWEKTGSGKGIPLDPEATEDGNIVIRGTAGVRIAHVLREGEEPFEGETRYKTHFVTCPNAKTHRNPR